eukprot:g44390.t1
MISVKESEGILQRFTIREEKKSAKGKGKKRMKELTHPGIRKVLKPLAVLIVCACVGVCISVDEESSKVTMLQ